MRSRSLTEGSISQSLFFFVLPLMLGQFLQQLYNVADAWVIGNFADNASFAAVSSCGNLSFLIVGFFMGLSTGAGVIIARYFGAQDSINVEKAIHTTVAFGILSSIIITIATTLLAPQILVWMKTPENVLPLSITYFRIYCLGISTVIMYNLFMAIMRALGDSISPLIFLCISSMINVLLDLLFVALLKLGVAGAAAATILAQGLSAILCFLQMQKDPYLRIYKEKLNLDSHKLYEIIMQGLPAGMQNSALSLGNVVVQSHVNSFGEYAMAGMGAHSKIEGFVFIPVLSIAMALATFVSQNIGAGKWDRVKRGSIYAVLSSLVIAQLIGLILYTHASTFLGFFTSDPKSIRYGCMFTRRLPLFYMFLAFTHAATGILQGMGRSIYAMVNMLMIWCFFRILYVTIALRICYDFRMICWAYPITWSLTTILFTIMLILIIPKVKKQLIS